MSRQNIAIAAFLALVCAATAGYAAFGLGRGRAAKPPPVLGALPAFSLTDQHGNAITQDDLRGHVWIANFIFTRCPTVCPVATRTMQKLQARTDSRVHLVSISVDPEYDTPARLAAYAKKFGADPARWRFLTGDPAAIKATVTDGLKLAFSRQGELAGGVPNIVHDLHFVLLDGNLRIRGYYDSTDPARLAALVRDATTLVGSGSHHPSH